MRHCDVRIGVLLGLKLPGSDRRRHEHSTEDRKSTRLNSSHLVISYAVFCLKKKKNQDLSSMMKKKTGASKITGIFKVREATTLYVMITEWYEHKAINDAGYEDTYTVIIYDA